VGFSYNSKVNLTFKDTPSFSDLGPLFRRLAARGLTSKELDIHSNVPEQFMLSGFHQLDDRVALLASAGWQEWSKFGQLEVSVDTRSPRVLAPTLPLKNTWHGALGAQITLDGGWTVNTGFAYDSKVQDNLFTPILPANDAWRFGLGGETELRKGLRWGLAVDYIYGGSPNLAEHGRPVILGGHGSFTGNYADENFVYVASYVSFKF